MGQLSTRELNASDGTLTTSGKQLEVRWTARHCSTESASRISSGHASRRIYLVGPLADSTAAETEAPRPMERRDPRLDGRRRLHLAPRPRRRLHRRQRRQWTNGPSLPRTGGGNGGAVATSSTTASSASTGGGGSGGTGGGFVETGAITGHSVIKQIDDQGMVQGHRYVDFSAGSTEILEARF